MRKLLLGGVMAAALFLSTGAHATLISIGFQQTGFNSGNIFNAANDGGSGAVAFVGSFGTFQFNTVTAQGAPALSQGMLSTGSIQTSSSTAGTITIYITAQGLTSPTGPTTFLSSFTSNAFSGAAVSVVESTLYSTSNALFGGTQLASQTFTAIGTSNPNFENTVNLTGIYSETTKYVVTVGAGSSSVNDTIVLSAAAVPEPASLALLGAGLIGVGLVKRRKGRASA